MKRTFQAKLTIRQYVLLAILLSVVVCFYWIPMPKPLLGILVGILIMLMAVIVSVMVGTFYVIYPDGYMDIIKGKVAMPIRINLKDIKRIDKIVRSGTLIIVMNNDKEYFLIPPRNEEDFIKCIEKYRS